MKTITVNNSMQFMSAVKDANEGDTIDLLPGEYFSSEKSPVLTIEKNLTIQSQFTDAKSVKLNCALIVHSNITLILKNLFITFDDEQLNTISLYDNSELFGNNIIVNRDNSKFNHRWDTIFAKNSAISLTNSEIMADDQKDIPGLTLENCRLMLVDSNIYFLCLRKTIAYLKNSLISFAIILENHSSLSYVDLAIDSLHNKNSDFYINDNCAVSGVNLKIFKKEPFIDIINSEFKNDIFTDGIDGIRWCFDELSTVLVDGKTPYNSGL